MRSRTLAALMLFVASTATAHEIGTTQVNATFLKNGRYRIDVITDQANLLARLELITGEDRSGMLPPQEVERRLESRRRLIIENIRLQFDGTPVTPELHFLPGRMRLEGPIPSGARLFRWSYGLTFSSYALTLLNEGDVRPVRQWLEGPSESQPFELRKQAPALSRAAIMLLYLKLGITHIIPKGLDHILFVLGIFLLSTRLRDVLTQVTAFTIAHSITLGLTIYGLVSLSPRIVEPAIALSIAYVGVENVLTSHVHPWRVALVFAFGLLHGMGFAGVLRELGLPRSEFLTALVAFNVGVEMGQLTVIALAFLLIACWARKKSWYRQAVIVPLSVLIAMTGLYWTVVRIAG